MWCVCVVCVCGVCVWCGVVWCGVVWCGVVWVGDWRLVGQGLHHTSFTCTKHHIQHQRFFCFFFCFFSHLDVRSFRSPVVFGVDAVLTDLQRAERKRLMRMRRSVCRRLVCVEAASACQVWRSRERVVKADALNFRGFTSSVRLSVLSASITWFLLPTLPMERLFASCHSPLVLLSGVSELADPELTAAYAETEDLDSLETPDTHWETFGQETPSSETVSATRSMCFKSTWPYRLSALPLASSPLSTVSEGYTSTLEQHGSLSTGDRKRVASMASPALTLFGIRHFCLLLPP